MSDIDDIYSIKLRPLANKQQFKSIMRFRTFPAGKMQIFILVLIKVSMPTIRRIFLILLTIAALFCGAIYALAYMVKPKTAELTITIPNDKLNLRAWPVQPVEPVRDEQALDADRLNEPSQ